MYSRDLQSTRNIERYRILVFSATLPRQSFGGSSASGAFWKSGWHGGWFSPSGWTVLHLRTDRGKIAVRFEKRFVLTRFVDNVLAGILVRQVLVHVLVGNAQSIVQHGQLLHGIGSFQHRFYRVLDESLSCEINLRQNNTKTFIWMSRTEGNINY